MPAVVGYFYIDTFGLWSTIEMLGLALKQMWCKLLLVSVFPDLAFIFVFYSADMWNVAKGLLIGAFPYLLGSIAFAL